MLLIFFVTISNDGAWTKEVRSLDETIQAYSMLESAEKNQNKIYVVKNTLNHSKIIPEIKKNYLHYKKISIQKFSSIKKLIFDGTAILEK